MVALPGIGRPQSGDRDGTPGITGFSLATPSLCGTFDFIKQHAPAIAALVTGAVV